MPRNQIIEEWSIGCAASWYHKRVSQIL